MKVVLDTNVLFAALRSPNGSSRFLLKRLRQGKIRAVISVPLMIEYEQVLSRREHRAASGASLEDIGLVLDVVAAVAEHTQVFYLWRPFLKDPKDDLVLETAVNGGAKGIVTFNQKDFSGVFDSFGIKILTPYAMAARILNEKD